MQYTNIRQSEVENVRKGKMLEKVLSCSGPVMAEDDDNYLILKCFEVRCWHGFPVMYNCHCSHS